MNSEQIRIVRRFEKLVRDAAKADLTVFIDGEALGIRLIATSEVQDTASDPRNLGVIVQFHSACGASPGTSTF